MTPQDIIVKDKGRRLVVVYDPGHVIELTSEFLRVESPSAEVQGHNASQKKLVAGKADVTITGAEPVGNYAIRLIFSDGHSTGLFTWDGLADMARDYETAWPRYLAALAAAGLSRNG